VEQESQLINGPQESSISGSSSILWKGRLRSSKIIHGNSQTSSRNFHVMMSQMIQRRVWVKN
jgi:hypothetical protein